MLREQNMPWHVCSHLRVDIENDDYLLLPIGLRIGLPIGLPDWLECGDTVSGNIHIFVCLQCLLSTNVERIKDTRQQHFSTRCSFVKILLIKETASVT